MNNVIAVIITYNVGKRLYKSIEVLKKQVKEVIVVDNGSEQETIEILKQIENEIKIVLLSENKGIAAALNIGIECAIKIGCDWILTLDHDSIIEDDMVDKMLCSYAAFNEKDKVAMIVPVHVEEKSSYEINKMKGLVKVLTEITSGSMVKTDIYRNVERYDEKLFIDLVDHDFCLKLNQKGYIILQDMSAVLYHNLGDSVTKSFFGINLTYTNHNEIRKYYMTRNRFYVWEKYKVGFAEWVNIDKKKFIRETIKILLFEKNKLKKITYTVKGYRDFKKRIYGKLIIR